MLGYNGRELTPWSLCDYFANRHPWHSVNTLSEGLFSRCEACDMQGNPEVLGRGNEMTTDCRRWVKKCRQHAAFVELRRALSHEFTIHSKELERLEAFKYLGCLVAFDDKNL